MSRPIVQINNYSEFNFRVFVIVLILGFSFLIYHFENRNAKTVVNYRAPEIGDKTERYLMRWENDQLTHSLRIKGQYVSVNSDEVQFVGHDDNGGTHFLKFYHNPFLGSFDFSTPIGGKGRIEHFGQVKEFFPLSPGKKALYRKVGNTEQSGEFVTSLECEFHGKRSIRVPAGDYNAALVTCKKPGPSNKGYHSKFWYDENSGQIVKRSARFTTTQGQAVRLEMELLKFKPARDPHQNHIPRKISSSSKPIKSYKVLHGSIETK